MTNVSSSDYDAMIAAANEWGVGSDSDPERRWFLAGWIDERDSATAQATPPPGDHATNMAEWAAYNSGRVAYMGYTHPIN